MSARQNKKQRKGRSNVHQRERTVTTLTEDPNTHYLVPTPSEEPARVSLSFNNPKMQNIQMGSSFGSYQYGSYPPFNIISQQQQTLPQQPQPQSQPQQQSQPMKPTLPPGKNDLDILQNLKQIIKDGQHPFFRAVPQPATLASIYMGTIPSQYQDQERRGETPGDSAEGQSAVATNGVSGPAANDTGRTQPPQMDDSHGRPLNRAPSDSQPNPVDSRPQPDSRGTPGSSQGPSMIAPADTDDIQSSRSSSLRLTDAANQNLGSVPSPSDGGGRPDMPLEDYGPRPSLKDRLVPPRSAGRASSEHPSHYGDHPGPHSRRPKFFKDRYVGASFDGPPRPGDRGPSGFGISPSNGTPMPGGGGGQAPPRSFHPSPPPESRGGKPLSSPPGTTHRHPPLGRSMGREDRGNYRAEYDPRRPDVLDDTLARYGDRSYRDFSPPLGEIPRGGGDRVGRPAPFPPSPGRAPPGGDISGRRGEWQYQQYPPSPGVPQNWDADEGWDRPGDRDRFERDVPPRGAGWDYRGDREFIARGVFLSSFVENSKLTWFLFSDGYSSAPPLDDRGYGPSLPNRDADRGRPPGPYTPPYGRVRPRSPSPMRRAGSGSMDDSRLVMKRPREDFPPSGYYPPVPSAGNRDGPGLMRRPPGEYPPPAPRSASTGPPPSSSSWPPPLASGASSVGPAGDRDRDYRMGRDGMDFPPPAGYDRPRTPPGPLGRHSYGRGGGGYGRGDPRDRGGYGRP